jgi:hypothetical protein
MIVADQQIDTVSSPDDLAGDSLRACKGGASVGDLPAGTNFCVSVYPSAQASRKKLAFVIFRALLLITFGSRAG